MFAPEITAALISSELPSSTASKRCLFYNEKATQIYFKNIESH